MEATEHTGFSCRGNRENSNCGQHRQKDLTFHHNSPLYGFGEIEILLATNAFTHTCLHLSDIYPKKISALIEIPNLTIFLLFPVHSDGFGILIVRGNACLALFKL
jgi:hypothetical protein